MLGFPGLPAAAAFGAFLAIFREEHHVFRAAVLSIVLTLAVGPGAALQCGPGCGAHPAAKDECHQEDHSGSPSVGGDDTCDHLVLGAVAVLREHVRRAESSPDVDHAMPVPRYQLVHSTIDVSPRHEPGRECSLDKRPLSIVLRV